MFWTVLGSWAEKELWELIMLKPGRAMHLIMAFVLVEVTPSLLPAQSIVWTETDSSLIRRANSDW
jgi:hypothetical protein